MISNARRENSKAINTLTQSWGWCLGRGGSSQQQPTTSRQQPTANSQQAAANSHDFWHGDTKARSKTTQTRPANHTATKNATKRGLHSWIECAMQSSEPQRTQRTYNFKHTYPTEIKIGVRAGKRQATATNT